MAEVGKFVALVSNLDASLCAVDPGGGLRFVERPADEVARLLVDLGAVVKDRARTQLFLWGLRPVGGPETAVVVEGSFQAPGRIERMRHAGGPGAAVWDGFAPYGNSIHNLVQKLRLFRGGRVCLVRWYAYIEGSLGRESFGGMEGGGPFGPGEPYKIAPREAPILEAFLRGFELPLRQGYLQSAQACLELTYQSYGTVVPVLVSMMGLEAVFGNGDSRYSGRRIREGTSRLLSSEAAERHKIDRRVSELYGIRSKAIHTGNQQAATGADHLECANYLRRVIVAASRTGLEKDALAANLGLGQPET